MKTVNNRQNKLIQLKRIGKSRGKNPVKFKTKKRG